ncbi:hypothetical protein [Maridesulfovibrio sp.]|uniref:hypothetical protein n=1 Tax=Maridesulfovibrio sp. TaxID=2795000 RepID=UPI002AA90241|nr:hypothetical protein [Maridesulfovibrio sp.]
MQKIRKTKAKKNCAKNVKRKTGNSKKRMMKKSEQGRKKTENRNGLKIKTNGSVERIKREKNENKTATRKNF